MGNHDNGGDSVQCRTDLGVCCSVEQGPHRGDWYFPNGTRLPFTDSPQRAVGESRGDQRVDLRHWKLGTSGIYHCDIPTNAVHDNSVNIDISVRDTVYIGLYLNEGEES